MIKLSNCTGAAEVVRLFARGLQARFSVRLSLARDPGSLSWSPDLPKSLRRGDGHSSQSTSFEARDIGSRIRRRLYISLEARIGQMRRVGFGSLPARSARSVGNASVLTVIDTRIHGPEQAKVRLVE